MNTEKAPVLYGDPPPRTSLANAPLTCVLAQVRFPRILSIAQEATVAPFQEAIRDKYPELAEETIQSFKMGNDGPVGMPTTTTLWRFQDDAGKWRITLTAEFVALETREYGSREEFIENLRVVTTALKETIKPSKSTRIGVRYIDQLRGEAFERLQELIEAPFLGAWTTDMGRSVSSMTTKAHWPIREGKLNAQWGMVPADKTIDENLAPVINEPSWILDFDAFDDQASGFDPAQIGEKADALCARVGAVFRSIVTDEFLRFYGGDL